MDLFNYDENPSMAVKAPKKSPVYSVSILSNKLRMLVEGSFNKVAVEGEISGFKQAASGHMYFDIKDENAVMNAIVWRTSATKLPMALEDGMHVILHGRLTTYPARSNYQIIVEKVEAAGLGALMQRFENLKKRLSSEGLFDEDLKHPLPFLPSKIGIITSPTGAVIEDMLHRLRDRFPTTVMLYPAKVQGNGAKEDIANGVKYFNDLPVAEHPDVLIVARGGGSLEDLWAFNEELVVRAIAASGIPVISAVGHEPDVTLCDFVADKRAPTPTAAAEMVVPVRADLQNLLNIQTSKLGSAMRNRISYLEKHLELKTKSLVHPKYQLDQTRLMVEEKSERLSRAISMRLDRLSQRVQAQRERLTPAVLARKLQQAQQALDARTKLLESYSPQGPLKRGYAYVTDASGVVVKSANASATHVVLNFNDGSREAELGKIIQK